MHCNICKCKIGCSASGSVTDDPVHGILCKLNPLLTSQKRLFSRRLSGPGHFFRNKVAVVCPESVLMQTAKVGTQRQRGGRNSWVTTLSSRRLSRVLLSQMHYEDAFGVGGEQECPQHPVVTERCDRWCTAPQNWVLNSSAVTLCNSAGDILHSPMSLNTKCNPQERACAHGSVLICCLPGDGVWQSWFSCSAAPLLSNKSLHLTSTGSCWSG